MENAGRSADYLFPIDQAELLKLCRAGRLYDIARWIDAGNSLQVTPSRQKKTLLQVAVETGFHSLVELLAKHENDRSSRNAALAVAVAMKRLDLVELLLSNGAEIRSIPLADVLLTWEPKIIRFFLEHGADPITGSPFTVAFAEKVRTALRPFIEYKQAHPELASNLQEQLDSALRYFAHEGDLKWVSLLLWAGGNPRTKGLRFGDDYTDDAESYSSAITEACHAEKVEVLKKFKPNAAQDNLSDLLSHAVFWKREETVQYLLHLGANLNDKPNGGSKALDTCLWHLTFAPYSVYGSRQPYAAFHFWGAFRCADTLVKHGAIWIPDDQYTVKSLRRSLLECEPGVTIELLKVLIPSKACSIETIKTFLSTPKMKDHLASKRWHMAHFGLKDILPKIEKPDGPSFYDLTHYDRNKLYEEVWTMPVQKIAKQYGLSDRGLGKVCKRLRIPVPGRGYWAKKLAGKPVKKRPPLAALPGATK